MSKNTNEQIPPQAAGAPAKKAAKKTAAKKTAAKKTAVKSAAKKVTKKASAVQGEIALILDQPPAPVAEKPARKPKAAEAAAAPASMVEEAPMKVAAKPRKTAAKKTAAEAVDATPPSRYAEAAPTPPPVAAPENSASADSPRRFGRVPGGGPTSQRESSAEPTAGAAPVAAEISQPAAAPAPQPPPSQQEPRERPPQADGHGDSQSTESRSKRRREKRKKRRDQNRGDQPPQQHQPQQQQRREHQQPQQRRDQNQRGGDNRGDYRNNNNDRNNDSRGGNNDHFQDRGPIQLTGEKIEIDGMLELAPKGFGFLRVPSKNFEQARDDIFVTPELIRKNHLRLGQWIHGLYQQGSRGPQLVEITSINGMTQEEASKLPHFDELKAINPNKRISFETTPERFTTRVVDIMAPVGRGQRGLIVSPPRSGKTTLLLHMAEAVREKYEENLHLMVLLVDERPEEVTEFRRSLPGAEIYASSNDENARNHCRIAELAIERAKRLVEAGKDVFLLMDSITRLARAYNGNMNNRGRGTGSGGLTIGSLEIPRRLFAAARNTRGGGSLTILATALIQTNSRADEAIFMEFKGTGNMELVLDRKIAENYIYPAVDIFKSGTRREELLLPEHMLHKIHLIRRGLSGHRPAEAMERLLYFLKKFPNNPQMLLEIKG
jgi:transcription termination factor Rho